MMSEKGQAVSPQLRGDGTFLHSDHYGLPHVCGFEEISPATCRSSSGGISLVVSGGCRSIVLTDKCCHRTVAVCLCTWLWHVQQPK